MEGLLIVWLLCAIGCAMIASSKNLNVGNWFVAGLFFGFIALLIVVASAKKDINAAATDNETAGQPWKCSKCGYINSYWTNKCQNWVVLTSSVKLHGDKNSKVICDSPRMAITPVISEKKCPMCAEMVKYDAKICRFCNHEFTETA